MQFVKITIPDRRDSARGMMAMSARGRIDCYPDQTFIVPEPALAVLADLGIAYQELDRGGLDYAQKTLRDSSTNHVQRRPVSG